jgi:hypothetical protein
MTEIYMCVEYSLFPHPVAAAALLESERPHSRRHGGSAVPNLSALPENMTKVVLTVMVRATVKGDSADPKRT